VTPEAKREAMEAGADCFLAKPIEALRLLDEVRVLGAHSAEEGSRRIQAIVPAKPAPAPEQAAVVNLDTLKHLEELGSSPSFVEKLVGVFLADGGSLLERLEQALAARNYAEIRAILHAIKGSSASIGTDRLTRVCTAFGAHSDAELRLKAPALLRSLSDEFIEARGALERHLEQRRKSTGSAG